MADAQADIILGHIRKLVAAQSQAQLPDQQLLRRFIGQGDEAAFSALVRRHGPMVLQVCRRVLHNLHDAEDAFQATFLLLARKAKSIRKQDSVSSWLHGVAFRLALRLNAAYGRQRRVPESLDRSAADPADDVTWRELRALLDQELSHLPEKYRTPLLLCYLEGQTRDEAAHQLGCPLGTLKSRLERGRELLRRRLVRRGLTLSAALLPLGLSSTASSAPVPTLLVHSTIRAALRLAAGKAATTGLVSTQVAALVEGGLKTMFLTKLKIAASLVLSVSIATGAGVLTHQAVAGKAPDSQQQTKAQLPAETVKRSVSVATGGQNLPATGKDEASDLLVVRNRVVDPEGKPVGGAKLYLLDFPAKATPPQVRATSAADGRFDFAVPRADVHIAHMYVNPWSLVGVLAVADGYGPAGGGQSRRKKAATPSCGLSKMMYPFVGGSLTYRENRSPALRSAWRI
jgi:RNA polymerase sigma factor (sigma-70 family)